ncbi:MAG: hypothetical protein DWI59_02280, partial [Chloroflexi bacterium]
MNQHHSIEHLILDVAFPSEGDARAMEQPMSEFARQRVVALVERLLDELSDPAIVVRIDELDIDLGELPRDGYLDEFEARLERQLREQLVLKLDAVRFPGATLDGVTVLTPAESERAHLAFYLRHGTLPAAATAVTAASLQETLERLLERDVEALTQLLRGDVATPDTIARLVRQFPEPLLVRATEVLAPLLAGVSSAIVDDVIALWRHLGLPNRPELELRTLLWELLLRAIVDAGQPPRTAEDALQPVLEELRRRSGLGADGYRAALARAGERVIADGTASAPMVRLIGALITRSDPAGTAVDATRTSTTPPLANRELLARPSAPDEGADDPPTRPTLPPALAEDEPGTTPSRLGPGAPKPPTSLLLAAPSSAEPESSPPPAAGSAHDSLAPPPAVAAPTAEQASADEPQAPPPASIEDAFESQALQTVASKGDASTAEDPAALARAYALYERLRDLLMPGGGSEPSVSRTDTDAFTTLIDELARVAPAQVLRLFREMQAQAASRSSTLPPLATTVPTWSLSSLVRSFL